MPDSLVKVKIRKSLLILKEHELTKALIEADLFSEAIRRGKAYKRQQRFKEMIAREGGSARG